MSSKALDIPLYISDLVTDPISKVTTSGVGPCRTDDGDAPPASRTSRRPAGSSPSTSASGRGGSTSGILSRPHCLTAAAATRSQRRDGPCRSQRLPRWQRRVTTGTMRDTPSSVACRITVSILPLS